MNPNINHKLVTILNTHIKPIDGKYDALIEKIGDARFVLMGEATHGTKEFYQARVDISKQLIQQKGFMGIAIEGDWPDVHSIHRYVQGYGNVNHWQSALKDFKRFPMWMWRNQTIASFIQWLRQYNDTVTSKIGFFGLDLYSLHSSVQAVIQYLMKVDPEAAKHAIDRYSCFDHFGADPQSYGFLTTAGLKKKCIQQVLEQVLEMQRHAIVYLKKNGAFGDDTYFQAIQNANLVKNAEAYYRSMFEERISSWNVRDTHMFETLNAISEHLENHFNKPAKIIVWAHNSHVGDARATEMGEKNELNLGQLVRQNLGSADTYLLGFSTNSGFVTAANNWDAPAQLMRVNPGMPGSYEELFHHLQHKNFLLDLRDNDQVLHFLKLARLQRAIGVIYRPETERYSHYFFTHLPFQFDSIIHFDETNAVQPLALEKESHISHEGNHL